MIPSNLSARRTRLILLLPAVAACTAYEPAPLPSWGDVAMARPAEPLTLATAVDWLLQHNERVVAARAELERAQSVAAIGTPLANPSFSIGPVFLSGANALSSSHQAFEAGLGWLLPLSGVRGATDDLRDAEADAARVAAIVAARTEYLGLREDVLALSVATERAAQARASQEVFRQLADRLRSLGRAGLSSLELQTVQLETLAVESLARGQEVEVLRAQGALAARCGAPANAVAELPGGTRPALPDSLPRLEPLLAVLAEHPDLVELRAAHEVAERTLRREVRKQYPDLSLGLGFEREEKVNRFVLPFGMDLALFDRNATGIAAAAATRAGLRQRYVARVRSLRTGLRSALAILRQEQARHAAIAGQVEILAGRIRSDVDALIRAGRMDSTEYAGALRRILEARSAELDARADLYRAWTGLERACGAPLLELPGEPASPLTLESK